MSKLFRFIVLIAIFTIAAVSCERDDGLTVDFPPNVTLRIENQTNEAISEVTSNSENFGELSAGAVTKYEGFEQIYQWPEIAFEVNEQAYEWTSPIDNVGFWAAVYESGAYTLVITAFDMEAPYNVEAELVED